MRESPTSDHTYSPAGLRPGEGRSRELQFEGLGSQYGGAGRVEGCAGSGKADPRVLAVSSGARYKSMSPARLPISRSPCITIPPGLSPTTLLESPVLLTGVKAEPSPTTGTFCMLSNLCRTVGSIKVSSPRNISNFREYEEGSCADFEFRPHVRTCSGAAPATDNLASVGTKQYKYNGIVQDIRQSNDLTLSLSPTSANEVVSFTAGVYNKAASSEPQQERDSQKEIQPSHTDHAGSDPVTGVGKTSEDGYNWRKYGQKLVKGSEFPRSYYKCTHPKCQVKKQLERSHDGQITDIIYKGRHDHPKPQPNRRLASDTALSCQEEEKIDGFTEDPGGPAELSPISVSEDDTEGTVVPSNINGDDVVDNNDPESKKRKIDASSIDMSAMGKTTREPRVVVQTLSEVDILDDGYRWRKYGQKVVKGNPNPRSYYKCTNVGCPVRKHVERASHDPKAVITTYEGKHNHDVPATRTNSHEFTVPMTINSSGAHSSQKAVTFSAPRIYDTPRAITQHYSHSESDVISLDLAVGLSPRHKERANDKMQTTETGNIHAASSAHHTLVMHAAPVASYYGNASSGMGYFRPRGETIESFSFSNPPLNHSTKAYPASMGSLLTGP